MKFVLVTGASGFVGRHACRHLLRAGYRVRGSVRQASAAQARPVESVDYAVSGPIDEATDWRALLAGIDAVVHCAARVHIRRETAAEPLAAFRRVNVAGTERLARQAAMTGSRRIVYVSSIGAAVAEADRTGAPHPTAYQISKLEGEGALRRVAKETGLEAVVLRPPLIYGPGCPGYFDVLLKAVDRHMPLPFASLRSRRSILFVGNLVDAIRVCIEHPAAAGRTFPLADGAPVSAPELVWALAQALGRRPLLLPCPPGLLRLFGRLVGQGAAAASLTSDLVIDDSDIRSRLGWRPRYSMAAALAETVADRAEP